MRPDLRVGSKFPDLELPDHTGATRLLSGSTEEHPTVLSYVCGSRESRGEPYPEEASIDG